MANQIATTDLVARTSLSILKYATPFIQTTRDYSRYFGDFSTNSKKSGLSVDVPIPPRYVVGGSKGSTDGSYSAQDHVEPVTPLVIDTYRKVHVPFTALEQSLELADFTENVVDPATRSEASVVEADHLQIINKFPNVVLAGASGVDIDDATNALAVLKENGTPAQGLKLIAPQRMHSSFVNNTANLFNPVKNVSMQYLEGYVGRASSFDWLISELMPAVSNGTANAGATADGLTPLGAINGATANGATTIVLDGVTTNGTIKAGQVIQIAGVEKVNGYTYQSIGVPRQFCVAADATSVGGAVTLTLTEKLIDGTGASSQPKSLQNISALPADDAVVSFVGEADTNYRQAFAYHTDSVIRAFCKLEMPRAGATASQKSRDGMIMRALETYDYDIDSNIFRLDCVSGNAVGRPEFGCRIWEKIA